MPNITKNDFYDAVDFISCSRDRQYILDNAKLKGTNPKEWKEVGTVDEFKTYRNGKFFVVSEGGCFMLFVAKRLFQLNMFDHGC